MRIRGWLPPLVLSFLTGCSVLHGPKYGETPTGATVHPFSANPEGLKVPMQWRPYILSRLKRSTDFTTINYDGTVVVKAVADSSASGLSQRLSLKVDETPFISWRWKVSDVPAEANNRLGPDDAAARVVVAFDGDRDKLDFEDRAFADRIKALSGNDVPYATLMYIWSNKDPVGTVIDNKHTSRIKMIVAESGHEKLKTWVKERWNLLEDFKRAFGELPGKVISVGIMSDTDNTGIRVETHYGDIQFEK
ncbi:MAG: DUF3047 domain-containing protein [Betaproteobacteria bacterium]|nr:DUF3047 domain-containing protein [Betaproteobacteria bacterium]